MHQFAKTGILHVKRFIKLHICDILAKKDLNNKIQKKSSNRFSLTLKTQQNATQFIATFPQHNIKKYIKIAKILFYNFFLTSISLDVIEPVGQILTHK